MELRNHISRGVFALLTCFILATCERDRKDDFSATFGTVTWQGDQVSFYQIMKNERLLWTFLYKGKWRNATYEVAGEEARIAFENNGVKCSASVTSGGICLVDDPPIRIPTD